MPSAASTFLCSSLAKEALFVLRMKPSAVANDQGRREVEKIFKA